MGQKVQLKNARSDYQKIENMWSNSWQINQRDKNCVFEKVERLKMN